MVRREPRTILTSGRSNGGFTLLEVVVALTVIAIAFTTLLEILSRAAAVYEESRALLESVLYMDEKLKRRDHEGLEVERRRLPDFPQINEVIYSRDGVFFIRYETR